MGLNVSLLGGTPESHGRARLLELAFTEIIAQLFFYGRLVICSRIPLNVMRTLRRLNKRHYSIARNQSSTLAKVPGL
jgi:hypothetical protein